MTDDKTLSELFLDFEAEQNESERAKLDADRSRRTMARRAYVKDHPEYVAMIDTLPLFEVFDLDEVDEEEMEGDYDSSRNDKLAEVPEAAHVVGSSLAKRDPDEEQHHRLLLDLDHPALLLDSSTPGHHHLYVDVEIEQEAWEKLIRALSEAGVIEEGYAEASLERGHTDLRLPWVKKP